MAVLPEQIQASLKDYVRIIFQRKWFFLVPFLVVFLTAAIGSFFLPRHYRSSVLIFVQEEDIINPLVPLQEKLMLYPQSKEVSLVEKLKTLTEQILSYPQLIKLVRILELDKGSNDPMVYESIINGIRSRTTVRVKAPDVFSVTYEDTDPIKARQLANALVALFIQESLQKKTESALIGVKFSEEQAKIYKTRLEDAEKELYEFKEKYALELPGQALDMNTQFLINYQTSVTSIELKLKESKTELEKINRQLRGQEPVIISEDLISLNPEVSRLNSELSIFQHDLDRRTTEDPNDPEIPWVMSKIEETRDRLRLESKKLIDADTALTAPLFYQRLEQKQKDALLGVRELEARRQSLQTLVDEYERKIETLPEQERLFSEFSRDVRVNQNIYEMLRMKVEEQQLTAVELKEKGVRYEVLEEARLPLKSSKPKKMLTAIVAFVIGALSGFGCVFLAEFADHSFRGVEDAKQYLDIPILASISKIVNAEELRGQRIRNVKLSWLFILFLTIMIIFAAFYSYIQEQKIMEKVIRQQVNEETGMRGMLKNNFAIKDKTQFKVDKEFKDSTKLNMDDKWMPFLRNKNIYSKLIIESLRGSAINTLGE
ncbi:MAG: GNVR domain-containing protein [Candidatus Omnitrophota bacterium]